MSEGKIPYITSPLLYGLRHGFFTRQGGVSQGVFHSLNCSFRENSSDKEVDKKENVLKNRALGMEALGVPIHSLQTLRQVHGSDVIDLVEPWGQGAQVPMADAVITQRTDVTLGIQTADCVPVLIADYDNQVIAAVHAGWRSALGGVIENTIALMMKKGARPEQTVAVIGPCIHQPSYEVGTDVADLFLAEDTMNERFFLSQEFPQKMLFDLPGYVRSQLERFQLKGIDTLPYDTYENEDLFFSCRRATHRHEKGFGGHLSVISLIPV